MKTLSYLNELRNVGSANANINSQSDAETALGLSPRKRKARGMFTADDISSEVVALQGQGPQEPVLFLSLSAFL